LEEFIKSIPNGDRAVVVDEMVIWDNSASSIEAGARSAGKKAWTVMNDNPNVTKIRVQFYGDCKDIHGNSEDTFSEPVDLTRSDFNDSKSAEAFADSIKWKVSLVSALAPLGQFRLCSGAAVGTTLDNLGQLLPQVQKTMLPITVRHNQSRIFGTKQHTSADLFGYRKT
jgi:hypothetical protein